MDISQIIENNQENIKKAEKILYLGPFLIGWVPGIWLYNFDTYEFKLALTGFLQLVIYSAILTLNHFLAYLDLGGYGNYPLYLDSLLAVGYLAVSIRNIRINWNQEEKTIPSPDGLLRAVENLTRIL